jgi:hypothetical protein
MQMQYNFHKNAVLEERRRRDYSRVSTLFKTQRAPFVRVFQNTTKERRDRI